MAATLSYYQPCRSHLAQPARCLDDRELPAPSISFRRRQFIEKCHEARGVRYRESLPAEVSVQKTREELTKNAIQNSLVNRRLNIESGWSKVEEVRKKFEGAVTASSFSRSFESPPRRRLADSLFASFKLPRKREIAMAQPRSLIPQNQPKRKSAVELLAETKAFYVKSETVLDRKQELPLRVSSGLGQAIAAGGCHLVSSSTLGNDACCNPYATPRSGLNARRAVSAGEGLQNTLRRLLEQSDSHENVYSPPVYAVPHKLFSETRRMKDCAHNTSGTFSGTSSSGTSGSKPQIKSDLEQSREIQKSIMNRPLSYGDTRVFFPESFVIPRQRPSEVTVVKNPYNIPSSHSSPENIQLPAPVLSPEGGAPCDDVGTISPPAQYAHSTQSRSNSHSQPCMREEDTCININSHKSLPDLHTQARCYTDHSTDTIGRSPRRRRRHSSHQRTASCSSKGTRSNHSSIVSSDAFSEHPSPGEDNYPYNSRCGSSFARDSGGSSGHYTQRSAPAQAQVHGQTAHRTDSGSSTQHSHNRYNNYYSETQCNDLHEWHVSAPPQFQDGAPSPPPQHPIVAPNCTRYPDTLVGIHFQASAPPPQFQDETSPINYDYDNCYNKTPVKCHTTGRINKNNHNSREYPRYHDPNTELIKLPQYQEIRIPRPRIEDTQEYINTQKCPGEEVTSPLGTFKRQRCLRYKQRKPRPILRSKSDISDRYRRNEGRSPALPPCEGEDSPDSPEDISTRLHQFFETLGIDEHAYDSIVSEPHMESPVFFSDTSTVDSNQIAVGADYTVHGPPQKQIYRNTEPPSVVERNARIIKWLCNCRKTQLLQ